MSDPISSNFQGSISTISGSTDKYIAFIDVTGGSIRFNRNVICNVLLVGGGGGGGAVSQVLPTSTTGNIYGPGGGGGGGSVGMGCIFFSSNVTYNITIGSGGLGGVESSISDYNYDSIYTNGIGGNTSIIGGDINEIAHGGGAGGGGFIQAYSSWYIPATIDTKLAGTQGGSGGGSTSYHYRASYQEYTKTSFEGGSVMKHNSNGRTSIKYYGNKGGNGNYIVLPQATHYIDGYSTSGGGGGASSVGYNGKKISSDNNYYHYRNAMNSNMGSQLQFPGGVGGDGIRWINNSYYGGGGGGGECNSSNVDAYGGYSFTYGINTRGGAGGIGGGGAGGGGYASTFRELPPGVGIPNTGGGGGGQSTYRYYIEPAARGGSGVVIIRYPTSASVNQVTDIMALSLRLSYIKTNLNLLNNISISNLFPIFPTSNITFRMSDLLISSNTSGFLPYNPAINALEIKTNTNTNIDGIYNIAGIHQISNRTYCLMDNIYDNGGWMMLLKATTGSTFKFSSTHWNTATTSNVNNLSRNITDLTNATDAKFEVFNYVPIKDVLALFPSGTNMHVNNWWYNTTTRVTALEGFNTARDATPSDPLLFSGFSSNLYSTQTYGRHVFGGHSHIGNNINGTVRWGFIWNNEPDWNSCDTWGGIGLSDWRDLTWSGRSAGNLNPGYIGSSVTDYSIVMELFGR